MTKIYFQVVEEPSVPTPPPAFDSNDILRMLDEGGNEFINLTEKMVTSSSHDFTNSESTNFFTNIFKGLHSVFSFFVVVRINCYIGIFCQFRSQSKKFINSWF